MPYEDSLLGLDFVQDYQFPPNIKMSTKQLLVTDRKAVREASGKTEKDIFKDIEIIREWFKTQPHLPEVPSKSDDLINECRTRVGKLCFY